MEGLGVVDTEGTLCLLTACTASVQDEEREREGEREGESSWPASRSLSHIFLHPTKTLCRKRLCLIVPCVSSCR